MALQICFFEDTKFDQFFPLTVLRPVYMLRAGMVPLYRRAERFFPGCELSFHARNQVSALLSEQMPDFRVNIIKQPDAEQDILFLNGRIRNYADLPKLVAEARLSTIFRQGEETVAVLLKPETSRLAPKVATHQEYTELVEKEADQIPDFRTTATLYNYCWDIMADIEPEITADFARLRDSFTAKPKFAVHDGAFLVNEKEIFLDDGVTLMPGTVIDASHGPVYVGANTKVEADAAIYGPTYIGPNCVVLAGKISGCSIGHTCRVGGEVEETIFHAYVNKYHAGFVGHSYVGQWVNFGAMTTNSDLKNNYSQIRCRVNGKAVDSGSIKVGSFIGDHTKFGIGTLLNTGITIGVCCNLFGGTLITDKEVAPFSWGGTGQYKKYQFDKAIDTALRAAERRNVTISQREIEILEAASKEELTGDGTIGW